MATLFFLKFKKFFGIICNEKKLLSVLYMNGKGDGFFEVFR